MLVTDKIVKLQPIGNFNLWTKYFSSQTTIVRMVLCICANEINTTVVIQTSDCNTVFPNRPTFMNCQYRCHCKNDAPCDQGTGDCDIGCEHGWMGPGCQYRKYIFYYL